MTKRGPRSDFELSDRDRLFRQAQYKVRVAIKRGDLKPIRDCICADCGAPAWCYDHRDYNRPLDVEPVCRTDNLRRGPGLPFPTEEDGQAHKNGMDGKVGTCWGGMGGGEGYEPLAARLLIDAPEAMNESDINASFWTGYARDRIPELFNYTWKARADWFKARDPWYA